MQLGFYLGNDRGCELTADKNYYYKISLELYQRKQSLSSVTCNITIRVFNIYNCWREEWVDLINITH